MSFNELLFDFVTLWVTVDPVGTVPLYLSVTKDMPTPARKRAALRATLIAFFLLAGFLYLGQYLLEAMRIEMLSFQIAGGIVLFLFALTMIFDRGLTRSASADEGHDVSIFPLAMPSIATPGALLAVVVLTDNNTHSFFQETLTCVVMALVLMATLVLMLLGDWIMRVDRALGRKRAQPSDGDDSRSRGGTDGLQRLPWRPGPGLRLFFRIM